jgi:hypothetical protein
MATKATIGSGKIGFDGQVKYTTFNIMYYLQQLSHVQSIFGPQDLFTDVLQNFFLNHFYCIMF